jgi:pyruvate dehydrogenase E2 component (dihydrolipoamide acetyltransferase)
MPSLGMVMTEGKIARWIAADGARVAKGDPIVEIETDKLTQEIGAPAAGVVRHAAAEGTVLPVEGVMGWVLAEGEPAPPRPVGEGGGGPGPPSSGTKGEGSARGGGNGSRPHPDPLPRGEGTAPGPLSLGWPEPVAPLGARPTALLPGSPLAAPRLEVPVSPIARRLAREMGVDLARLKGSGPGGRIVEADVQAAAAAHEEPSRSPAPGGRGEVLRRVPLTGARRVIADRMTASLATGAQLTLSREVDASALVAAREASKGTFGALPYDAYFVRALALALAEEPTLNASVEGDEIVVYGAVQVGVAVALPGGLVVPVVRDAARASLDEVARQIADLTARARAGRLSPDDLAGGTVTITNLGGYGVDVFTPILNPPQSAILGVGRIAPRPVVVAGGALAARPTVHLSLTFDHRVADGAPAAELLGRVAELLAYPRRLAGT